jgi:hypothetical protein
MDVGKIKTPHWIWPSGALKINHKNYNTGF